MTSFILRRIGQSIVVLFGVSLIVFVLIHLLPGGPARAMLGPTATPQQVLHFTEENGWNRPVLVQYGQYMGRLFHGNLGFSYTYNQSVASLLEDDIPKTALLVGLAYIFTMLIAVPLGIIQALRANTTVDHAITGGTFVAYSMPGFWLSTLLILWFSVSLHIFPSEGPQGATVAAAFHDPQGLVLPVASLTLISVAMFSRFMRSSATTVLVQDYIRTARGKGVPLRRLIRRHLLRNALGPMITLLGVSLPFIIGGAIVTESVFNYPGMGLLLWKAATSRDYPLLMGFTLVVGVATVVGSLVSDVLYAVVDPRVRYDHLIPLSEPAATLGSRVPAGPQIATVTREKWLVAKSFFRNPVGLLGSGILLFMLLFSFLGPVLYHTNQVSTNLHTVARAPSGAHLLGTDESGYDVMGRLMVAGRSTLEVGFAAALIASTVGTAWGAVAGFLGGWVDSIMMRVVDSLFAIPPLLLILVAATIFVPTVPVIIAIIAVVSWLITARLVRGECLSLREREYMAAARVGGATKWRVLLRHLVPNLIDIIVVQTTIEMANAILLLAALSFLGLGPPLPSTNWGDMLSQGLTFIYDGYWWLIYPAGIAIVLTVVGLNLVGDAVRDAFDIRLRGR